MVSISLTISGIVAIILGILVLLFPKLLRIVVGLYLIFIGIVQLINVYF